MARKDETLAFLNDPTRVRIYTFEERKARALDRPQTDAEEREALRRWRKQGLIGEAAVQAVEQRRAYRDVQDRDPTEELARRPAPRTDPWAGIDTNPWKITEEERKRWGLGRFR